MFENNVGGICTIGSWEGCDNCVSGQSECIAQYECRVEGQCEEGGFVQDGIIGVSGRVLVDDLLAVRCQWYVDEKNKASQKCH